MKSMFLPLATVLLFMLVFNSCKTKATDPNSAAKGFTEALMNDDFDAAEDFATRESHSTLEMLKSAKQMSEPSGSQESMNIMKAAVGKTVTYSNAKMDGTDRAIISVMANGKEVTPLILKKEEGFWKVAYDIASIMDGERLNLRDKSLPFTEQSDSFITNLAKMNDSIEDAYNKARKDLDSTMVDAPGRQ